MTLNYRDLKDLKETKDHKEGKDHGAVNGKMDGILHGRKLSPRTLRMHFRVSPQFLEEAKNFVFNKDSMSFAPVFPSLFPTTGINNNPPTTFTFADLAVLPLNAPLPNSNQPNTMPQITNATNKSKTISNTHRNLSTPSSQTITVTSNSPPNFDIWESVKEE
jgi:hypothetical protein